MTIDVEVSMDQLIAHADTSFQGISGNRDCVGVEIALLPHLALQIHA